MLDKIEITLRDGTLVRHKHNGYTGKIEGTTAINACFTTGSLPITAATKEVFQYRIAVTGETRRYIAPLEDLEIVDEATAVICVRCHKNFYSKPGLAGKVGGRCSCGGWICPVCLACQSEEAASAQTTACPAQRKRFLKSAAAKK